MKKTIRIFISSPGDVARERHVTAGVITRLQSEFTDLVNLEPYFWEWEPLEFSKDYQSNIPSTADFEIVICLLWSRLGSRLGDNHTLPPDYTRPASSGTEYELLQALHGKKQHPESLPDLMVWVNKAPPPSATSPPLSRQEEDERLHQRRALQDFLAELTRDATTGIYTGAVNRYEIPDENIDGYHYLDQFEELMEQKLRKLILKHVGQRGAKPKVQWKGSPFRDLDVFEFHHAPIFFGRSRAVGEVIRLLQNSLAQPTPCNFAVILGASGSGKSSLARAGIVPMLTQPGVIEGVGHWRCAIMRPSDDSLDLFHALASAILKEQTIEPNLSLGALPELADSEAKSSQRDLASNLRNHPESLVQRITDKLAEVSRLHEVRQRNSLEQEIVVLKRESRIDDVARKQKSLDQLKPVAARFVLLLDQMEELFTLNYAPDHLRAFLRAIDILARSGRVFVVATLRSDFYPRFQNPVITDKEPDNILVALARDGARYDLLPPTADEVSQIIRRPAVLAGLDFEEDTSTRHSLADTLRDEALSDPEALPLLEHVLNRLYQAQAARSNGLLAFEDYESLGGVGGALAKHAENIFMGKAQDLDSLEVPWDKSIFDKVFRCLVTLGEGELEGT